MNAKKKNRTRRLRKDERAVSPVIGVILMVAITVVMAAIIAAFVYGYAGTMEKTAQCSIKVTTNRATSKADLKIMHMGGDILYNGSWNVSVTKAGEPLNWAIGKADFDPGDEIIVETETNSTANVNDTAIRDGTPLSRGTEYRVVIRDIPTGTILVDQCVRAT